MAEKENLNNYNSFPEVQTFAPTYTPQVYESKKELSSMMNGITNAITGTVNGISSGVSNTMNSIPHIMDEQRKNFVFQFQEVMECVNLMERQGIINRPQQVTVTEREHVGFGKFIAIVVGGCWLVIKLAAIVL